MRYCAIALQILFAFAILTISAQERWAVSVFQAGIYSLAAVLAIHRSPVKLNFLVLPLGACAMWPFLQLLTGRTVYRFETLQAGLFWTANFAVFVIALQVFAHGELREAFLRALVIFGFAVSVVSVIQLFTSDGKVFWIIPTGYQDLVLGPFVYHNNFAAFVELVLPVAMLEAMRNRRRALVFSVITGVMVASVIASQSRSGFILVLLEIIGMLVLGRVHKLLSTRLLLVTIGTAVGVTAIVGWENLWQRFQEHNPYSLRRELSLSSLKMVRERPWTGFGLGTWPAVYPAYALLDNGAFANHAHNDWAEWAAEGGLPFFLGLLSIAGWTAWQSLRFPWALGVTSVFLHSLVDYPMQKPALAALVFALIAALAQQHSGQKRRGIGASSDRQSVPNRRTSLAHGPAREHRSQERENPGEAESAYQPSRRHWPVRLTRGFLIPAD